MSAGVELFPWPARHIRRRLHVSWQALLGAGLLDLLQDRQPAKAKPETSATSTTH